MLQFIATPFVSFQHTSSFWFARALICLLTVCFSTLHADDNCLPWQDAATDPAAGKYALQLRTCEITYGLSTQVQIQNNSDQRLDVSFRITTKDNNSKESNAVLEPRVTTSAGNCQACAKRHAGFLSWEIISIKALENSSPKLPDKNPVMTPAPAGVPAPAAVNPQSPAATDSHPIKPVTATPPEKPQSANKNVPVDAVAKPDLAKEKENKEQEGFKTEDGTVIPYEQLPPEFRPHRK